MIIPGTIAAAAEAWRDAEKQELRARANYIQANNLLKELESACAKAHRNCDAQHKQVSSLLDNIKRRKKEVARAAELWAERKTQK